MARRKLALVGFERGAGPWIRATGHENGVWVPELKDGELVCMEVENLLGYQHCFAGMTAIRLSAGQMYRFLKTVREGVKPSKTSVEVILNGG